MQWHEAVDSVARYGEIPPATGLTHDSRLVEPGWAFVALPGAKTDGHAYLAQAVERRAGSLVVQADRQDRWRDFAGRVPLLVVRDCRAAAGPLAARIHGRPSSSMKLVGVTGTNGKTTTTHLTSHVLTQCGISCGYLSSVGFEVGTRRFANDTHMTTLEAPLIQSHLAEAAATQSQAMVVEASSEGLAQERLAGCEFDLAVFTNLTRDHLDFHLTMERYLLAKQRLFEMTFSAEDKGIPKAAILNGDDPASRQIEAATSLRAIKYGMEAGNELRAGRVEEVAGGLEMEIAAGGTSFAARTPLRGRFNAYNCLAAVAAARAFGLDTEAAVAALASFAGIPGRLEAVHQGQDFNVFVDIASTPDALEKALLATRNVTSERLWVVFGAAGGRDAERRGGMGKVAGRLADKAVLTNEDPRHEDPDAIIAAIAAGLQESGRREGEDFWRVPDRTEALRFAFGRAAGGDSVLLAGKATETTMIFGEEHRPWDERAAARRLLAEL